MQNTSLRKSAGSDIPQLTVRDMLRPLFRHRLVMVFTFSTIFLLSILVAVVWGGHYWVATMQVLVARERLDPAVTPQPTAAVQEAAKVVTTDDVDSEVELLQGRDMLREVAQTCKLADSGSSSSSRKDSHDQDFRRA